MTKSFFIALVLPVVFATSALAQAGRFIHVYGGPQMVALNNADDAVVDTVSILRLTTYRIGAGIDYIHNWSASYGWQTGLYYSQQGQSYRGFLTHDGNTGQRVDTNFTSHVHLDYLRVPIMLRFSTGQEFDNAWLGATLYMGFQLGYLMSVSDVYNSRGIADTVAAKYANFDLKQTYTSLDFGLSAGGQLNFRINDRNFINLGLRWSRSLTSIEKNYDYPRDIPVEYMHPVSASKWRRPSNIDMRQRAATNNNAILLSLGYTFRIGTVVERTPVYRGDE